MRGSNHPGWKGGRFVDRNGYVWVLDPIGGGHIREHILVMEGILGRRLVKGETVHHRNGRRDDNRPENLELWYSPGQPSGQRSTDLVEYARGIMRLYAPQELK
jgi:hypothetical protein